MIRFIIIPIVAQICSAQRYEISGDIALSANPEIKFEWMPPIPAGLQWNLGGIPAREQYLDVEAQEHQWEQRVLYFNGEAQKLVESRQPRFRALDRRFIEEYIHQFYPHDDVPNPNLDSAFRTYDIAVAKLRDEQMRSMP